MKSRNLVSLCFFLALLGCFIWWMFPLATTKGGVLLTVMTRPQEVTSGPGPWLFFVLAVVFFFSRSRGFQPRKRHTYGSASYATRSEARAFSLTSQLTRRLSHRLIAPLGIPLLKRGDTTPNGQQGSLFVVGSYHGRVIALQEKEQEEHTLLTASTGGGKTTLEIAPNLLRETGSRSLFIADLKNELYRITAETLARYHHIWWFTPLRPEKSHGYNPLAHIHNAMDANMFAD